MDEKITLPVLNAEELRVLGSLMEKSKTTPDYYPMSINGIMAACNQKTSRKPVVEYDEEIITSALNSLKKKGLVATATGGTSRTIKYRHTAGVAFPLVPAEIALLCLLILRGPQTPGELNTNSGRLHEFESLEEIQSILEKLANEETPFVVQLSRRPGQKEQRFMHLLGGKDLLQDDDVEFQGKSPSGLEGRVAALEQQLAELKSAFDDLMKQLS